MSDGVIEDLRILRNTIRFTNAEVDPRGYDAQANGMRIFSIAEPPPAIDGLEIRGNRITGAPSTGIYLGSPLPSGGTIVGNRIEGAGTGVAAIAGGLRSGLIVFGAYDGIEVRGNCFVEPATPAGRRLAQVMYVFDAGTGANVVRGNARTAPAGATLGPWGALRRRRGGRVDGGTAARDLWGGDRRRGGGRAAPPGSRAARADRPRPDGPDGRRQSARVGSGTRAPAPERSFP